MNAVPSQGVWQRLLWSLVYPYRHNRAEPTASGTVLVALSFAVGLAAYNSSNNILFIALSLLLSSLLLSGLFSWLNLRGVRASLLGCGPARAGEPLSVQTEISNRGGLFPVYGLWLDMRAEPEADSAMPTPVSPLLGPVGRRSRKSLRDRLALVGSLVFESRLHLGRGIVPGGSARTTWSWVPPRRGVWLVHVSGMGSLFPFGFLQKRMAVAELRRVIVRPATLRYEAPGLEPAPRPGAGGRRSRRGAGSDLLALRPYAQGDSHRLIHWKASARLGRLLVRENSEEAGAPFALRFDPDPTVWSDPAQLERGVSLAAELASDLFKRERLQALQLAGEPWVRIRGSADLESWLDRLACVVPRVQPRNATAAGPAPGAIVITLRPEGPNGAAAHADGRKIAIA